MRKLVVGGATLRPGRGAMLTLTSRCLRRMPLVLAFFPVLFVGACSRGGSSPTIPAPTYNDISGSYAGALVATTQGVALNGSISLTITESAGRLSGSYGMTGRLTEGMITVPVQGTGIISGEIAAGNNPSVHFILRNGVCPNYSAAFSGSYDTTHLQLKISGPVYIFDTMCNMQLMYNSTITLSR